MQPVATLLQDLGLALLCGALAARLWLRGAGSRQRRLLMPRLAGSGICSALLCLAGTLCVLWAAAAAMGDSPLLQAGGALRIMLLQTSIGHLGIASLALLLLLIAALLTGRGLPGPAVTGALLCAYAFSRAASGHAAEHGILSIAVMVEWLHLLCASLWLGVVLLSAWLLVPAMPSAGTPQETADAGMLARISRTATIALAGVVLSGLYNAWRGVGAWENLAGNPYASALQVKLALIALAVALGAYNRFAGFPALAARGAGSLSWQAAHARVLLALRVESLVLLAALAAAAVLTGEAPPAHG